MGEVVDLLDRAVYSFGQIDHILRLAKGTSSRWIDGYTRSGRFYAPVIRSESTGEQAATWGEFVECRLLSEFRGAGVRMHRLRPAVEALRGVTGAKYPLASAKLWLASDGRDLLLRIQENLQLDADLSLVLRSGQYAFDWSPAARNFRSSLRWSSDEDDAVPVALQPDQSNPLVVIDPERGFGDPVVAGRGVTTSVIAELVRAGDPLDQVAEAYELSRDQVEAAVRYELQRVPA